MPDFILWAIVVILVVIVMLMFSVTKRATKEAVYLSSFVALMCIEDDVYRNNAPKLKQWVNQNVDQVTTDPKSAYSVNKAITRLAMSFLDQLGGPAAPLIARLSELKQGKKV